LRREFYVNVKFENKVDFSKYQTVYIRIDRMFYDDYLTLI